MAVPSLHIDELRKCFGATTALAGVSLHVDEGEIFGLLGPNGAGKTTLLSIVAGLLEADGGNVQVRGQPLTRDRKHLLGIVPQELALYGELTARENLRFFGQLYGVHGPVLDDRVAGILRAVGLAERADDPVHTFSGGMKRRLNLGAGLVHGPKLLLLDEPTAGVDPQSRRHIFEEVRRLNSLGMTIVYTSHYMEEVQALCPRVGIMDRGRLIACDAVSQLLQRLPSVIRLHLRQPAPELAAELRFIPDMDVREMGATILELHCRDSTAGLLRIASLVEPHVAAMDVETPNLERVFLHLTGSQLRD